MKIKIVAILSAVLIFSFAPFTIIANAEITDFVDKDDIVVTDYNQYITDITIDGDNDTITCVIPVQNPDGAECEWAYLDKDGNTLQWGKSQSYWVYVPIENAVGTNKFIVTAYPFGLKYLNSKYIPSGTEFTYTVSVATNAINPNLSSSLLTSAMSIAINENNVIEKWNKGQSVVIGSDLYGTVTSTFSKGSNTKYLVPAIQMSCSPMESKYTSVSLKECTMQFSLKTALREQEQSGETNILLQQIVNSSPEIQQRVEELQNDYNEQSSEADNVLSDISDMYKPDYEEVIDGADTFDVVTENDITQFTDIYSAVLQSDIVKNMLLCCCAIALISLVLFGKKG